VDIANHAVIYGPLDPHRVTLFPKNRTLARFFTQLGWVEELGASVRNVARYLAAYRPRDKAEFVEEDVFRPTIPIPINSGSASLTCPKLVDALAVIAEFKMTEAVK
jgi:ATP-dependent DNA helicase RecG